MLGIWRIPPCLLSSKRGSRISGFCCRAEDQQIQPNELQFDKKKKKVVVVGSGWAGLGAAHHLCKQEFDVTVLEGCYEFGSKKISLTPDDIGIRGFWYPYRNMFALVDELGIKPFTNWMASAQYSRDGLEVKFPVFQDLPQLPTPFGTFIHTQFVRLPLVDRLTILPLMAAIIDFDNTDIAWRKYDQITARELFKQYGCSERFYRDVVNPLLQVGLFAPAAQCSAAATLAIIYYFILAHQKDFDLVWCRGTVKEKIFEPWMDSMRNHGCKFLEGRRVTDFAYDEETGCISEVSCGKESLKADVVILAVGISTMQDIIQNSAALCTKEEFLKVLNLASIDLVTIKLWLDKKVNMPNASNACSGFDDSSGWTFFNLNVIHDKHKDDPVTVLQADFYHANELLLLKDEDIVGKVMACLSKCIKDFENVSVIDKDIGRFPKLLTHFFQEKSFVTGLEAANRVVDYLEVGMFAKILPVEEDEPQIQALRSLNRNLNEIRAQIPWSNYFIE